jgi:hypothetical protein
LYENSPKSVTISLCGKLGCGRRRRCLASASEVEPNGAANGEGGEGGEGEPEAAGAEARRSGPEEAELGTEAEEDKARPPGPPRPPDHQPDHHRHPYRYCAQQYVDECLSDRRPPQKLHHIEERLLHFTGSQRQNEARSTRTIDERRREFGRG